MQAPVLAFLASLESPSLYSKNTRLAYQSDMRDFITCLQKMFDRPIILADFNPHNVSRYLEASRQHGQQESTILRRMASLRRFEAYLYQEGYIHAGDDSPGGSLPSLSTLPKPRHSHFHFLSEQHLNTLRDILDASPRPVSLRDRAILEVLLATGLSVSALVDLDLTDLDLRSRRLHLRTVSQEDHWLPLETSTHSLDKYIKEGRPELHPSPDQPALFISQIGARMSRQGAWQVLGHLGRAAGLPFKLSPRIVRHTAVIHLANSSHSTHEIQLLIGHRNLLSTQALLHRLASAKE